MEPLPHNVIHNTDPDRSDTMLDEMMSTADFEIPLSNVDPVDLIPASTKSKTW